MTFKFSFEFKGFAVDAEATHGGDRVTLAATVTHPALPSAEELMSHVFAGIKGLKKEEVAE